MNSKYSYINKISLRGGVLCFDFINTMHDRKNLPSDDYLINYRAFLYWSKRLMVMPPGRIRLLEKHSGRNARSAEKTLRTIKQNREILYRFFSSLAAGKGIDSKLLIKFNSILSVSLRHIRFIYKSNGLELSWHNGKISQYEPFWVIIKSVFDVITEGNFDRIKECKDCGWIFMDKTKNKNRKWCNMQTCGAKNKARRFYQRKKLLKKSDKLVY